MAVVSVQLKAWLLQSVAISENSECAILDHCNAPLGTTCGQVVRKVPTTRTTGTSTVRTRTGTTTTATIRALGLFVSVINFVFIIYFRMVKIYTNFDRFFYRM